MCSWERHRYTHCEKNWQSTGETIQATRKLQSAFLRSHRFICVSAQQLQQDALAALIAMSSCASANAHASIGVVSQWPLFGRMSRKHQLNLSWETQALGTPCMLTCDSQILAHYCDHGAQASSHISVHCRISLLLAPKGIPAMVPIMHND